MNVPFHSFTICITIKTYFNVLANTFKTKTLLVCVVILVMFLFTSSLTEPLCCVFVSHATRTNLDIMIICHFLMYLYEKLIFPLDKVKS